MDLKAYTVTKWDTCSQYDVNKDLSLWLCTNLNCDGGMLAGLKALSLDARLSVMKKMGVNTLAATVCRKHDGKVCAGVGLKHCAEDGHGH